MISNKKRKFHHASESKAELEAHVSDSDGLSPKFSSAEEEPVKDRTTAPLPAKAKLDGSTRQTKDQHDKKREKVPNKGQKRDAEDEAYIGEIYKSSTFKAQVEDLLRHVGLRYGAKEAPAERALRTLKTIIEGIPRREPVLLADAEERLRSHGVAIPFPQPRPSIDVKYKFEYAKPANINVIGSYPLRLATRVGREIRLDLAVTMPSPIFQEKDYLNYRYFYKKAYYLACLASEIVEAKDHAFSLQFDNLNGSKLHPVIVVQLSAGAEELSSPQYQINIIPIAPPELFPPEKTMPDRNCTRIGLSEGSGQPTSSPSPVYNASLRADCSALAYLKLLHTTSAACESYKDACMLGRIWLRQRGLGSSSSSGGFGNFEWSLLIALLLQSRGSGGLPRVSERYSSYQLFKVALQFLASRDMIQQPVLFRAGDVSLPKENKVPVFFDGPRYLNFLFKMTPWSYKLLQQEARTTVSLLGDSVSHQFDETFIIRTDPVLYRFDIVADVPLSSLLSDSDDGVTDTRFSQYCIRLHGALCQGLGDRVSLVMLSAPKHSPWHIESAPPVLEKEAAVSVGFIIDPLNWHRNVDHGPPANEKEQAKMFRQFWGERAELRRFKDGSILESLVWSSKGSGPSVFEQIVLYLISRFIGKEVAKETKIFGIGYPTVLSPNHSRFEAPTSTYGHVMTAFRQLENDIRALEGLPLHIRHISAAASELSYASLEVPLTDEKARTIKPADVIIQFEGSGRWPDDLPAVQSTKIAFLLKMGELLEESVNGLIARVGRENDRYSLLNQAYLDLLYPSSVAFRLRIHHDREPTILERLLKDVNVDSHEKEEAGIALAAYRRASVRSPSHTQSIHNLCIRFPALSSTIRLLKRWFSSHLLIPHIASALVELLAARSFLHPYPWVAPSSPNTGFYRSLFFLSQWDWHNEPLVVDLNNSLQPSDLATISTRFVAWRKLDPALNRVVLFAATSNDHDGTTWTDHSKPPKVIAARMTSLARAACRLIQDQGLHLNPAQLFSSSYKDYDFLIHMDARFTSNRQAQADQRDSSMQFKNLALQSATAARNPDLVGFDPVLVFLEELMDVYGHAILFFHDGHGGNAIAGLWNPALDNKTWRVRLRYSTVPLSRETADMERDGDSQSGEEDTDGESMGQTCINKEGILNEIARLGGDMIRHIEVIKR